MACEALQGRLEVPGGWLLVQRLMFVNDILFNKNS